MKKVDVLIVGQGIAGSLMAFYAIKRGMKVGIIDAPMEGRASFVAGGLINPVTGRRIKKSWNYDLFYDRLTDTYVEIDNLLGIKSFYQMPIYRLLATMEDVNNWEIQRLESEYQPYMKAVVFDLDARIVPHQGAGVIEKGGWLDTVTFLKAFRQYISEKEFLSEEVFDYHQVTANQYKDISFEKIIFCEGFRISANPFFPDFNLWSTKGETLLIKTEGDDLKYILNKNMLLIPMGNGIYKVGATLERNTDTSVTEKGLEELKEKIASVIQSPYQILQQEAGIRPNVRDRKPMLGVSLQYDNFYVFNGLGSKGVSLAPYFADHLLRYMLDSQPLQEDVNWQRILR